MKTIQEKIKKFLSAQGAYWLVILAIILPWFFKSGYLFFTDFVRGPIVPVDWTRGSFLMNLIWKFLDYFLPSAFIQKIFIGLILALILFGGRLLVKAILKYQAGQGAGKFFPVKQEAREFSSDEKELASSVPSAGLVFVLSLFALFNPFVYDRALYGQFGVLIAYGALLFTAAYLFEFWRTLKAKELFLAAMFTGLTLMFALHFIFFLLPLYLIFFLALFLKRKAVRSARVGRFFWLKLLVAGAIIIALNANWLFAMASGQSSIVEFVEQGISHQDLFTFQTSGNIPAETFTKVVLMSGFWGQDQNRYADLATTPGWQKAFVILLPFILYGVYLSFYRASRRQKIFSISLIIIYLASVILAVGVKSPLFAPIIFWLHDNLPGYRGLREPQKFVALVIPIYLFYLSLAVRRISLSRFFSRLSLVRRHLIALVFALIIFAQAPLLIFGFAGQVRPTPYPADWYQINELLLSRSKENRACSDRILFLPWHMYMSFNWTGRIIANPAPQFFSCPVQTGTNMEWGGIYDNSQNPVSAAVDVWMREEGLSGPPVLPDGESFRYIILAKELDWLNYLWLAKLGYLNLILETETLVVFEINY
ncbi:MAG: hypothetical protein WC545_00190 [Patescibacteria group bacterium]